jgi:sulfatase modifying factor 1
MSAMPWVGGSGRRRLASGMVALVSCGALEVGCGKSKSKSSPLSPTAGVSMSGSGGAAAGRASDGGASAGTSSAGRGSAGRGGSDDGGEGGVPTNDAGTTASGGTISTGGGANAGGSSGAGGSSAGSEASGNGGAGGSAGAAGQCTGCGELGSCWSDAAGFRCVAAVVPLPNGIAIDVTEVTRGQYAAWLASNPDVTAPPEVCEWNESFSPDPACMSKPSVCQGDDCSTHPQPCIDFCDATAYCSALGRRLCTQTEWTSSCSSDGAEPLGHEPGPGACNDYTIGGSTTVPVGSMPGCQPPAASGFSGVFDMIGNVEEWVDDCAVGDTCKPRGLSYGAGAAAPTCDQSTYAERAVTREKLGFRCCTPITPP